MSRSSRCMWASLGLGLLLLLAACGQGHRVSPAVYLLNHQHWTPILVLNFAEEVAPLDAVGTAPATPPTLEPAITGEWRWEDPSRLVFRPERQTLPPDTPLAINLERLKLRPGYTPPRNLSYHTPPLAVASLTCLWQKTGEQNQRQFQATLEFNYPVIDPALSATVNDQNPLELSRSGTSQVIATSQGLVRPAADGRLRFELKPGTLHLVDHDDNANPKPGTATELTAGVNCERPMTRADWDTLEEAPARPPTATGLTLSLESGKLAIRLQGENLTESSRKSAAGQAVNGVTLNPNLDGAWSYGEAADGPDLWFTPAKPWPPGIRLAVTVAATTFPKLTFDPKALSGTLDIPAMAGSVSGLALYVDPVDPRIKRITGDIQYTHPLRRGSLEAKTSLRFRIEPEKSWHRAAPLAYELSYDDKTPGLAHFKTVPIQIPERPGEIRVEVGGGVESNLGGEPSQRPASATLPIPSVRNYFGIETVDTQTVVKPDGDLERLLMVKTRVPLQDPAALASAVEVYLLPDCAETLPDRPKLCADKAISVWESADQVDADTLKLSQKLPVKSQDAAANDEDRTHYGLTFSGPEQRQVLILIKQGLESLDGFRLAQNSRHLATLAQNPRELKILHDGALLSLTGTKKLGVAVRGLAKVRVRLQRILPHNLHHLAQFTRGDFRNPEFELPVDHFAETFTYEETLPEGKAMARHYFAVDFARFQKNQGFPPLGMFLLTVSEITPDAASCEDQADTADDIEATNDEAPEDGTDENADSCSNYPGEDSGGIHDRRLVLLTDLGMLVKTGKGGEQDVFVMSFRSGQPVAGVNVWLQGKNGVPVASGKTDALGYTRLPSVAGLKDEKTPTVYLAEKDKDLSFLPYSREDRLLDFSRFDTGGVHDAADSLQAFLFSDRGIYRPGDTVHIGLMLKKRDWSDLPPGLPLEAVITDPENQEIDTRTLSFGAEGFETVDWTSSASGKTGGYRVELFVAKNRNKSLGHVQFRVEEFQPDRLQVKTELPGAQGWISPDAARAKITVRNLFGTPAAGNPVKLEMTARPWFGQVPGFPDYRFRTTVSDHLPDFPQDLGETQTNDQGEAAFELPLTNIAEPVYEIILAGEGFEKGSGRSVVGVAQALVSRHPLLLGHAADGGLDYIPMGSTRPLKLLAVGPDFQPKDVPELLVEVFATRYVSTLVKREDGLYSYQSVRRDQPRQTGRLALPGGKTVWNLPTASPGQFYAVFKTAQGEELNRVAWTVAGEGNVSRNIERNAELSLTLSKKEYAPGEEVEVQIVAPYQGAGLLTLEQDGVIASRWFKTTGTASVQRIPLPRTAAGNAYLSVAFVRAMDSPEIYMSPLSYGVAPFAISRQGFINEVNLTVPDSVQPGGNLELRYRVQEATRLVLYAVDEGILQFAHYKNPQPLDFFFRKRALQVSTQQILDQILPDYALVQKLSLPGGDEDEEAFGKYKNPFARKHKPPMAFWSGPIDATPGEHSLSIPVPDYFNGSIRVLAVAANARKLSASTARVVARNPYVIQPQQPYAVAPGDEFDLGVLVANATGDAGTKTLQISVEAPPAALEFIPPQPQTLSLAPGQDGTVRFHAKAKEHLGPVNLIYRASDGSREAHYGEELSIRPSQPLMTTLQNGVLKIVEQQQTKTVTLAQTRMLYPEQAQAEFAVSVTPTAYLRGIIDYLKTYPYGCTEQIVSQGFPALVLGANPELGLNQADVDRYVNKTLRILQTRQKFDGGFGLWSAADAVHPYYSIYATHFLIEARERGMKVPDALYQRAVDYLDRYAQDRYYHWPEHEAKAYALYLLARTQHSIAQRLRAFEAELPWNQASLSANRVRFLLGAAYKLQQLDTDADRYFGEFQRQWDKTGLLPWNLQSDPEAMNLYLYLANRHFPELLNSQNPRFGNYLLELGQDLVKRRVNSHSGSLAVLGLGSLWARFEQDQGQAFAVTTGNTPLELQGQSVKRAALALGKQSLELKGNGRWNLYYQLTERGYDRDAPQAAIAKQLAIQRALLNDQGEEVKELKLQDKLHIRFALHPDRPMNDVAVVMLIPGGFEIDLDAESLGARHSLPIKDKPLWQPTYIDVQEDRVVFFGNLDGGEKYFEFRLKPLNTGTYRVPPVFAEGMYDGDILYRGLAGSIAVKE